MKTSKASTARLTPSDAATQIKALIDADPRRHASDLEVDVTLRDNGTAEVQIRTMYEYVNLSFADMEKVAAVLGTKEINVDHDSSPGCDSCDYGSRYDVTLYAKHAVLRSEQGEPPKAPQKALEVPEIPPPSDSKG